MGKSLLAAVVWAVVLFILGCAGSRRAMNRNISIPAIVEPEIIIDPSTIDSSAYFIMPGLEELWMIQDSIMRAPEWKKAPSP